MIRRRVLLLLFATATLLAVFVPASALAVGNVHDQPQGLPDLDARTGKVEPTAAQKQLAASLGEVRWNRFGTPKSLINHNGHLAGGLAGKNATEAARAWIAANKGLFRLSDADVAGLELVNDAKLAGTNAYAVLFQQQFGALEPTQDGQIAVGVAGSPAAGWNIAYVSSSLAGDPGTPGQGSITPQAAWAIAAKNVGRDVSVAQISNVVTEAGWTRFEVAGLSYFQRARLRALPTPSGGVRPVYEAVVMDFQAGHLTGYTVLVDAQTEQVLLRRNEVQSLAPVETQAFSGTYGPALADCGENGPYASPPGTKTIQVAAKSTNDTNDIVLDLYRLEAGGGRTQVGHSDTATSPEAIVYDSSGDADGTQYVVSVCPFVAGTEDGYQGTIAFNTAAGVPDAFAYPPKWKYFQANPKLAGTDHPTYNLSDEDTRIVGCWDTSSAFTTKSLADCFLELQNTASRLPWDVISPSTPTSTTTGNNALSSEAWFAAVGPPQVFGSPVALGPGPTGYQPKSTTRDYIYGRNDTWNNQQCGPVAYAPSPGVAPNPATGANDIDAATTNLFAAHNRMHDWSYYLGFTERNYNFQVSNFGLTPASRENDPEVGNVQAGAVSGAPGPNPQTSYGGRNNANQLTLPDGVPGLTNMYLWQPRAGSNYPPCVDGDYDMSVVGHEYGHGIQNRMVAGPDNQLSGHQARAMGESWGDLTAVEYLNEYNLVPVDGENPFAVGPYVTGNKTRGIRSYGMNDSPLNYSDVGYDNTGTLSPHADGEIWSATNFDIRQALIAKYNGAFPASDATLQRRCADGELAADACPGNRRWVQLFHDAFLLMADGAVSMVDARDAYLAADRLRFGGANQRELWLSFARRGLGTNAVSPADAVEVEPEANFESPLESNAAVTFTARAANEGGAAVTSAKVFVGRYEARVTPIADTDPATTRPATAAFAPGTYELLVQAPGYGHLRLTRTFRAGQTTSVVLNLPTNYASTYKNAFPTANVTDGINHEQLIDDTEATNWASVGSPVAGKRVTIDLSGAAPVTLRRVQVSAFVHPGNDVDPEEPDVAQPRMSALRQFEIWTCNASSANCSRADAYTKIATSAPDAFPGVRPRPAAPEMILRSFAVPATTATHVQLRVVTNQCTGQVGYQGEQDRDPLTTTDCAEGSTMDEEVRAAELQVFRS